VFQEHLHLVSLATRVESLHSLQVHSILAVAVEADIQMILEPSIVLHRRKAAQSPFSTLLWFAAFKTWGAKRTFG